MKQAFENLGWSLKENVIQRGGVWGKPSALVAVNPEADGYDASIVQEADGSIKLHGNFDKHGQLEVLCSEGSRAGRKGPWNENRVGWDWGVVKQEYQKLSLSRYAKTKGGTVQTRKLKDGSLELELHL